MIKAKVISKNCVHQSDKKTRDKRPRSLWYDAFERLKKNRLATLGLGFILLQSVLAIFAPWIAPFPYEETNLLLGPVSPNLTSSCVWN